MTNDSDHTKVVANKMPGASDTSSADPHDCMSVIGVRRRATRTSSTKASPPSKALIVSPTRRTVVGSSVNR